MDFSLVAGGAYTFRDRPRRSIPRRRIRGRSAARADDSRRAIEAHDEGSRSGGRPAGQDQTDSRGFAEEDGGLEKRFQRGPANYAAEDDADPAGYERSSPSATQRYAKSKVRQTGAGA